jgi:hypothetical protein
MFKSIMEWAPHLVVILSVNAYSVVLYANAALSKLLGWPKESLQGR